MVKKYSKKTISFLLVICLFFSAFQIVSASADETEPKINTDLSGITHLDKKTIETNGFIGRITGEEDLNSYVFLNADGSHTAYIFPENIKYVNKDGKISEKDTILIPDEKGGYTVKANDYYVNLPQNIKDGYTFSAVKHDIKITPMGIDAEAKIEENSVLYEADSKTTFKYTLTLSGVKEDIILNEYTGKNTFDFTLFSKDLVPKENDGIISLFDEKNNPIIDFEKIYAYDAKGNIALGDISITIENEENTYKISVSVDEEFLTNPSTEYPVTIDPAITESSDGTAIQDAPVFNGDDDRTHNYGSFEYNSIGATSMGTARTVVKLYGLSQNSIYKTLDYTELTLCKLWVKEASGNNEKYVNLYRINNQANWTENTVTWDDIEGHYNTSINCGRNIGNGNSVEFDITDFAKGWKNGSYTNSMSVVFTMSGEESSSLIQFNSSEKVGENVKPVIMFSYRYANLMNAGSYYIVNKELQKYLQPVGGLSGTSVNTGMELRDFSGSNAQVWVISSIGSGYYKIKNKSSGLLLTVPADSYSSENEQLVQRSASDNTPGQRWRIYMTTYSGFAIKPQSANPSSDGDGWTNLVMSVNDGNNGNGAIVSQRSYAYNNSFKDEWYLVPTTISSGSTYFLKNRQLSTNARPVNGTIQSNQGIELWTAGTGNEQKWVFTRQTDGYYKISPKNNSSYALTVASGSETAENGTVRLESYSSANTRQRWLIYRVPGGYCLKAKSSGTANLVLSVSEGNLGNGAIVSQRAFVNNLSYKEEWNITQYDTIPDGIYYLKQGNQYLTVEGSNISNNTNVIISNLAGSSASIAQKAAQMWKIKSIGDIYYSIRPLHKLEMGLNANLPNAEILTIGSSDIYSDIPSSSWITVHMSNDGYIIRNRGAEAGTLLATGPTSGSNVEFAEASGDALKNWEIVEVTPSNTPKGIALYDKTTGAPVNTVTKYIAPEQTVSLSDLNLVASVINPTVVGQNATLSVSSSNQSYLNIDSSNRLVGVKYKSTAIPVTVSANISGTNHSKTFSVYVPRVANGEYFLENRQKEQYAHINDGLTTNRDVIRYNFTGDNNERWEIKLNNQTGYYTIKSLASESAPYYLQVLNNSTALDQIVVVNTYSGTLPTGMQWKFELTANGSYKILPKSGESSGYVLSTGSIQTDLRQGSYVDNASYLDEWYLYNVGSKAASEVRNNCDAFFLSIVHTGNEPFITYSKMGKCMHNLHQAGYNKFRFVKTEDFEDEDNCIKQIAKSRISVIGSHGGLDNTYNSTYQILKNKANYINGNYLSGVIIDGYDIQQSSYANFSNVDLIIYLGCYTGARNSNLCSASVAKGARYAIGFTDSIVFPECNDWLESFFEAYTAGESIEDACNIAIEQIPYSNVFSGAQFGLESVIIYTMED